VRDKEVKAVTTRKRKIRKRKRMWKKNKNTAHTQQDLYLTEGTAHSFLIIEMVSVNYSTLINIFRPF
jgi:hypothetical protein